MGWAGYIILINYGFRIISKWWLYWNIGGLLISSQTKDTSQII